MYVGSSEKEINKVEWNHRNYWRFDNSYESKFRKQLREQGDNWKFYWVMVPVNISRDLAEVMEQKFIEMLDPIYNVDKRPYETSTRRGRNDGKFKSLLI